ncbi:MAG: hypothetical protein KatS3mg052_0931 [Candidatus Roseilinea sp.]|nr:MAG: hypothetical protein KatS3mg052_0931 [Candidatus Roseilinea sp.]
MHGAQPLVVAVDQRVGQRLAQRAFGVVGHAHAQQAHHQLLFAVAGTDARLDFFHHPQERPAEEVVDLDVESAQYLEGDLMAGHEATQGVFLAEEQQRRQPNPAHGTVGFHDTERLGQLEIGQIEQRFVAAPAPLAHAAPETLELERVEVLPTCVGDGLRRWVEQPTAGLQRLYGVTVHRHAGGFAISAKRAT